MLQGNDIIPNEAHFHIRFYSLWII